MQKKSHYKRQKLAFGINPVIKFLILSDVILMGSAGLFGPIFALFVEDFIVGSDAAVAGLATGVYLFSRSILQIPIAHLIDKVKGETDDFYFLFWFSLLFSLVPISYLFIETPSQLYLVQLLLGFFTAFTFPSFMGIFTRHIDKGNEGLEWGFYHTLTDVTSSLLAIAGGYIAVSLGFPTLILIVVVMSVIGSLLLLPIKPYILHKNK